MRVIAESLDVLVDFNGVKCRLWEAVSEGGALLYLFVPFFAIDRANEKEAIEAAMVPVNDLPDQQRIEDALNGLRDAQL